jgi:hypothetical protein
MLSLQPGARGLRKFQIVSPARCRSNAFLRAWSVTFITTIRVSKRSDQRLQRWVTELGLNSGINAAIDDILFANSAMVANCDCTNCTICVDELVNPPLILVTNVMSLFFYYPTSMYCSSVRYALQLATLLFTSCFAYGLGLYSVCNQLYMRATCSNVNTTVEMCLALCLYRT